jgi:RNA polymerase sigma-70 factor (ECF subfamily)
VSRERKSVAGLGPAGPPKTPRPLGDVDDRDLVARALEGDESAFAELLERFRRPVFSLIYRMIGDREQAEDLAQESFVKAFNNLDTYNPSYRFSSWLFKIASAEREEETRIVLESHDESPEQEMLALELGSEIEEAIARLRPEYRTAVILRHIESRPYEEIAEIMDVPIGTVKTFLHRARAELREMLGHLREEP